MTADCALISLTAGHFTQHQEARVLTSTHAFRHDGPRGPGQLRASLHGLHQPVGFEHKIDQVVREVPNFMVL